MSQKKKIGHRPKGLPKTGGRKKGTRNKRNLRLREIFAERGFDYVGQVMNTFEQIEDPVVRMDYLMKLGPFFMQRLRQEQEAQAGALGGLSPGEDEIPSEEEISTADLLAIAKGEKA